MKDTAFRRRCIRTTVTASSPPGAAIPISERRARGMPPAARRRELCLGGDARRDRARHRRQGDGLVFSIVDATEHRLAQQRLTDSELRYRVLVEASPSLIWVCDA